MVTVENPLAEVEKVAQSNPQKAIELLQKLVQKSSGSSESDAKTKEQALIKLAQLYRKQNRSADLAKLIGSSSSFLADIPKAKAAKLVKTLIDTLAQLPQTTLLQVNICKEMIAWANTDKRIYLKQSLETRLVSLYLDSKKYTEALELISELLRELKRLDDKMALVEVHLLESRVYFALRNLPKSKSGLTSARTAANSIYCPPLLQAGLDMQSGIIHAEEKDYKTAYSYFFETMESYSSQEDPRAVTSLKYMIMCKIMLGLNEDINSIVHGKLALKYLGPEIDAMKAVAKAHQNRSLQEFEEALSRFKDALGDDPIIRSHLASLYDTLLVQNLLRIIEPFSRVEIEHVAKLVKLPTIQVESKLSQMILDHQLNGVLDQGAGCLIVYDDSEVDKTFEYSLQTVKNMENVVESLYKKAAKLT